jgi:uncharacterized membrane protein
MCIGVIRYLIPILIASVLIAAAVIVLWFVFGMIINFYKIYLKPKKPIDKKECNHDHIVLDKAHPQWPFACTACGKRF